MDSSSLITEITENDHADITLSANEQIYSDLRLLLKFEKRIVNFETRHDTIVVCLFTRSSLHLAKSATDSTVKFAKWRKIMKSM